MIRGLRCLLLVAAALGACARSAPAPQALSVFAAASLTDAFAEIAAQFEAAHPGVQVRVNFAGSRNLLTQLTQGAQADVFAPASAEEMDAAIAAGLVRRGDERVFLTNDLVVILPPDNPAGLNALADLARPGIKLVLASEDVPVGRYSRQVLENLQAGLGAGFVNRVLANVVSSEDNVRQIVAKVQLGEADAGMVYTSDAVAAPHLITLPVPAEYNVVAEYPIAVLAASPQPDLAARFVEFVLSAEGQAVLARWGFKPVNR